MAQAEDTRIDTTGEACDRVAPPTIILDPSPDRFYSLAHPAILWLAVIGGIVVVVTFSAIGSVFGKQMGAFLAGMAAFLLYLTCVGSAVLAVNNRALGQLEIRPMETPQNAVRRTAPILESSDSVARCAALARNLARAGRTNVIVRFGRLDPLQPIAHYFEPIRWEDGGAALISDQPGEQIPDVRVAQSARHKLVRYVRLRATLFGFWMMGFMFTVELSRAVRRGNWGEPALYGSAIALYAFLLIPPNYRGQVNWWILPGGVLSGPARWFGSDKARLFRRTQCVVIAYPLGRGRWGISIADRERSEQTVGTQAEVDFALRALASPLSPPTLEMVKGLA